MLIPTSKNVRNITDFRKDPDSILESVKKGPLYLFRGSIPKAVVVDIEEYASLQEQLEDYYDSLSAKEYIENPEQGGITLEEFIKKYKIDLPKKKTKKAGDNV